MTRPLLFSYRRCPYAMRARMALLLAGVAFDVCEIALRDKPAELLALSPKGTVPVLQLADGTVLEESFDIMAWAFSSQDAQGWWARAQTPENRALLEVNDGTFKHHLDRYKYPHRFGETDPFLHRAQALTLLLLPLEARLCRSNHLGGALPCATDIAIFPFVRQFAAVEPAWFSQQPLPAVQAWLSHWIASELFAACMVRLPAHQ